MIKQKNIFLTFLLIGCFSSIKATEIKGLTINSFAGKIANLVEYADYVTKDFKIISSTIIDDKGKFNFNIDLKKTKQTIIQIDYLIGIIYLDPNQEYSVYFPPISEDGTYKLTRNNVNLVFKTIPDNDINGYIMEFDRNYDQFLLDNRYKVGTKLFHSKLDTFRRAMLDTFGLVKNDFFEKYVTYSIADMELVAPSSYQKINKISVYNKYIINRKIDYQHPVQMKFLMNFYEKALKNQMGKTGIAINTSLTTYPSYVSMDTMLNKDYFFKMQSIRELVVAENLYTLFYDMQYDPNAMIDVLQELKSVTTTPELNTLITNVTNKLIRLQPGTQAFPFELIDKNGERVTLESFKGKYVYINFWAVWNKDSQAEMELFQTMKEEYGDIVEFVSINIDSKVSKFNNFVASHPDYDWTMLYYGGDANLLDNYEVFNAPHYLLIDAEGKIVSAPANGPAPNGDYISIDKTFFDLKKKLKKQKRFIPGQKND